ncbi:MAG: DUF1173 family protein [Pseudomonadota bacterium]|nr:DUF1173 family protein [Pseudomonadota bacterium]
MNSVRIRFDEDTVVDREWLEADFERCQRILERYHGTNPMCLCKGQGVSMYIARRNHCHLARMPNSAAVHAVYCPSYEPPVEQTGRQVYGKEAIHYNANGTATVRLATALSSPTVESWGSDSEIEASEGRGDVVGSTLTNALRNTVSLSGLLSLMWETAGFNRWSPRMKGKRTWPVVRKYVSSAAERIIVGRRRLSDRLYLPERFIGSQAGPIGARRREQFARVMRKHGRRRNSLVVLGQIRTFIRGDYGDSIRLRHLGNDVTFWLGGKAARIAERWRLEETMMWKSRSVIVLMVVDRMPQTGALQVKDIGLMRVDGNYLPVCDDNHGELIEALVERERHFVVQMVYEEGGVDFPRLLLTDAGEDAVPMMALAARVSEEKKMVEREVLIRWRERYGRVWVWDQVRQGKTVPGFPGN